MADETEQAMYTDEEVRARQFPKPEPGGAVGSIPLSKTELPHHGGVDPEKEDDRSRKEEPAEKEPAESS